MSFIAAHVIQDIICGGNNVSLATTFYPANCSIRRA